jgi:hypothetical protein
MLASVFLSSQGVSSPSVMTMFGMRIPVEISDDLLRIGHW